MFARRRVLNIAAAAFAAVGMTFAMTFAMTGCDQLVKTLDPDPGSSGVLKIGVIQPHGYFVSFARGAELARMELNAEGGILGHQIEFIYRDNQNGLVFPTPESTIQAAEELIHGENVFALLGPTFSSNAVHLGNTAQQTQTPILVNATSGAVSASSEYIFLVAGTTGSQGEGLAKFALSTDNLGATTAAALSQAGDLYSEVLADAFAKKFEDLGGSVLARETYEVGSKTFADSLGRTLAGNPDVVLMASFAPEVPLAINEAREAGYEGVFLGGTGWNDPDSFFHALEDNSVLDGSFFTSNFSAEAPGASVQRFVAGYQAAYGTTPPGQSSKGYDAMKLLAQAIETAGKLDAPAVRDALAATTNYEGATAIVRYNEHRQPLKEIVIMTIQNGESSFYQLLAP